jgi:hypothetical protein
MAEPRLAPSALAGLRARDAVEVLRLLRLTRRRLEIRPQAPLIHTV